MKTIVLKDVQALHGGQKLFLRSDGTGICQIITWNRDIAGFYEKRFQMALSREEMGRVLNLVNADSFQKISVKERPGLPDEARPTIAITTASGKSFAVSKWAGIKDEEFDAVYQVLIELVKSSQQRKPDFEGKYDREWVPGGFSLP